MPASLAVQLHSLGSQPSTGPDQVCERLASIGYVGVEPVLVAGTDPAALELARSMGGPELPPIETAALRRSLDASGMVVPAAHAQLPEGPNAEAALDELELLGSTRLVVPAVFDVARQTVETFDDLHRIEALAGRFNAAAERARPRGIRIGYHNHFWELAADFDGRSGLEVFFEMVEPDVFAEVDLYWAQLGGKEPAELLESLGSRVELVHVKDGDGRPQPSCPLGTGVVDIAVALGAAPSAVWHVVELEGLGEEEVWPVLEHAYRFLVESGLSRATSS